MCFDVSRVYEARATFSVRSGNFPGTSSVDLPVWRLRYRIWLRSWPGSAPNSAAYSVTQLRDADAPFLALFTVLFTVPRSYARMLVTPSRVPLLASRSRTHRGLEDCPQRKYTKWNVDMFAAARQVESMHYSRKEAQIHADHIRCCTNCIERCVPQPRFIRIFPHDILLTKTSIVIPRRDVNVGRCVDAQNQ
jgi:hypothetical protein